MPCRQGVERSFSSGGVVRSVRDVKRVIREERAGLVQGGKLAGGLRTLDRVARGTRVDPPWNDSDQLSKRGTHGPRSSHKEIH